MGGLHCSHSARRPLARRQMIGQKLYLVTTIVGRTSSCSEKSMYFRPESWNDEQSDTPLEPIFSFDEKLDFKFEECYRGRYRNNRMMDEWSNNRIYRFGTMSYGQFLRFQVLWQLILDSPHRLLFFLPSPVAFNIHIYSLSLSLRWCWFIVDGWNIIGYKLYCLKDDICKRFTYWDDLIFSHFPQASVSQHFLVMFTWKLYLALLSQTLMNHESIQP